MRVINKTPKPFERGDKVISKNWLKKQVKPELRDTIFTVKHCLLFGKSRKKEIWFIILDNPSRSFVPCYMFNKVEDSNRKNRIEKLYYDAI